MNQFAIHETPDGGELVCRIQTDLGVDTAYILAAPVVRRADWGPPVPVLHVPVDLDGEPHLVLMTQMVALPAAAFGREIGTAAAGRDAIVRAVDLLVLGF